MGTHVSSANGFFWLAALNFNLMAPAHIQTYIDCSYANARVNNRGLSCPTPQQKSFLRYSYCCRRLPLHLRGWPVKREWEMCPSVELRLGPQTPVE